MYRIKRVGTDIYTIQALIVLFFALNCLSTAGLNRNKKNCLSPLALASLKKDFPVSER